MSSALGTVCRWGAGNAKGNVSDVAIHVNYQEANSGSHFAYWIPHIGRRRATVSGYHIGSGEHFLNIGGAICLSDAAPFCMWEDAAVEAAFFPSYRMEVCGGSNGVPGALVAKLGNIQALVVPVKGRVRAPTLWANLVEDAPVVARDHSM